MRLSRAVTRWTDRAFDVGVLLFAAWTIAYHLCLVLRLGVDWAWGLTAVCMVAWWALLRWLPDQPPATVEADPAPETPRPAVGALLRREWPAVVAVVTAIATAIGMLAGISFALVAPCWLVSAVAGTVTAWRWMRRRGGGGVAEVAEADGATHERWAPLIAYVWAIAMAVISVFTMGPSPDDMYYLNLSQWVTEFGTFPHRDTMYADLVYPMSNWPPAASYDTLVGAVARVFSVQAATIEYEVVVPVAAFLAVLVLWRLLRSWRVRPAILALTVMMLSLMVGVHGFPATPGEGLVVRLWQGKFVLTWLAIPWLVVHLVRYFDRPSRRQLVLLFAGGAAAVGTSTTGIFVVPVVALAAAVPLARDSVRRALACLIAAGAYPAGAGVVTKLVGGRSADLFETHDLSRFDPNVLAQSFLFNGPITLFLVPVTLLSALLIPHRSARVMAGVLAVVMGVIFLPGFAHFSYQTIGLGPTIRRIEKGLVLLALVGVAVVWLGNHLRRWRVPLVVTVAVATAFFTYAHAPVRAQMVSSWQRPFHWQILDQDREAAERIIHDGADGGLVLAPDHLAIAITISTTTVKTMATRAYYLEYLKDDPTFQYAARLQLQGFVDNPGPWEHGRRALLEQSLAAVPVTVACVFASAPQRARALQDAGFDPYFTTKAYRCLRRTGSTEDVS